MPHKWLVDPAALGARLPVSPCPPAFLFYLDAEESVSPRGEGERTFQVACAEESEILRSELREMHPEAIGTLDDGPFPGISVRFGKGARPMTGLTALWRRHRDSILYIEELRPPASRRQGNAVIRPVEAASLLIPLVRDMLNRGDDGLLMKSHSGRLTSLVAELAGLLRSVACYRVTAGTPELTAEAVDRVVRGRKGRV